MKVNAIACNQIKYMWIENEETVDRNSCFMHVKIACNLFI